MADPDYLAGVLLLLTQLALPVIAIDAVLGHFFSLELLSGLLRQVTYVGGLVGVADQLYWLATDRVPALMADIDIM